MVLGCNGLAVPKVVKTSNKKKGCEFMKRKEANQLMLNKIEYKYSCE
jgi:hypothetical protein